MKMIVAAAVGLFALAGAAQSQETDDWEYGEDAGRKMTAAVTRYDSGHAFVVQCVDQALTVLITGIPGPDEGLVWLDVVRADGRRDRLPWNRAAGGSLRAEAGGRTARLMRGGCVIQVRGGEAATPVRAAFELPSESQNLEKVLTACGAEAPGNRDDLAVFEGEVGAVDWSRATANALPQGAEGAVWARGSCLIGPALTLTQCRVDDVSPNGGRLADGLIREMEGATVTPADGEVAVGKVEYFDLAIVQEIRTSIVPG
jgi:hypothetical protein